MFYRQTIRDAKYENINEIIKLYDFWESYNFIKDYERDVYTAKYTGVEKSYYNVIYIFTVVKDDVVREEIYIAAQEIYKEDDLSELRQLCACDACSSNFLVRRTYCLHCCGCLYGANPSNENIYKARLAKNPNYKKETEDKPRALEESMNIGDMPPKVGLHRSQSMPSIQIQSVITS